MAIAQGARLGANRAKASCVSPVPMRAIAPKLVEKEDSRSLGGKILALALVRSAMARSARRGAIAKRRLRRIADLVHLSPD